MPLRPDLGVRAPRPSALAIVSFAALLLVPSGAPAQTSVPGAHVDVVAKPSLALAGQAVTIAGSTGYHAKKHAATVLVRHESGTPSTTLTADVLPQGGFSVAFSDTKKTGKYLVTVTSPDGKGQGQATFRVDKPVIVDWTIDIDARSARHGKH